MDAMLYEAIRMAEELRLEHNGIGGVYLYLGHDGDNVCELKDSDAKRVGHGCSGRSPLEAIQRAYADFCKRRITTEVREAPYRPPVSLDGAARFIDGFFRCNEAVTDAKPPESPPEEIATGRYAVLKSGGDPMAVTRVYHKYAACELFVPGAVSAEATFLKADLRLAGLVEVVGGKLVEVYPHLQPETPKPEEPCAADARGNTALCLPTRALVVVKSNTTPEAVIQAKVKKWLAGDDCALVLGESDQVEVLHVPG